MSRNFNFKTNKIDFDLDHMKINNDYTLTLEANTVPSLVIIIKPVVHKQEAHRP